MISTPRSIATPGSATWTVCIASPHDIQARNYVPKSLAGWAQHCLRQSRACEQWTCYGVAVCPIGSSWQDARRGHAKLLHHRFERWTRRSLEYWECIVLHPVLIASCEVPVWIWYTKLQHPLPNIRSNDLVQVCYIMLQNAMLVIGIILPLLSSSRAIDPKCLDLWP